MSGKELLESMSYVDEKYVEEAENEALKNSGGILWKKWIPAAACFCIVAGGVLAFWNPFSQVMTQDTAAESSQSNISVESIVEDFEIQYENDPAECPAVILSVGKLTENGFTGTVTKLVDTEIFEVGMELNVVLEAATESAMEYTGGMLVQVQFISYDTETGTIVVNMVEILDTMQGG